jgi:hypothetical protein
MRASDNTGAPQAHRGLRSVKEHRNQSGYQDHAAERQAGVPKVTPGGTEFSGLGLPRVRERYGFKEDRGARFLGTDNEVCHAWLVGALQQLRPEGQATVVGYLEAVLEEIIFEMKVPPGSCP